MTDTSTSDVLGHAAGRPRIVVGVDGSPGSYAALRWALQHTRGGATEVEAVYVLEPLVPLDFTGAGFDAAVATAQDLDAEARAILDRVVADTSDGTAVSVRKVVIEHPNPGQALVRAAAGAALLVVGAHHHHGLGFLLGSTGASCMRHATCPVVIVPEDWYLPVPVRSSSLEEALP
jgi:nucleotide-binding universal stress UspA family protein